MGTGLTVSLPSYCRHHMPNVAGSWQHWRQGRGPPKTESLPRHSNLAPSSGSSLSGVYSLPDLGGPGRLYLEIGWDDEPYNTPNDSNLSRVEICKLEVPLIAQNEKLSGTLKQIPPQ